MLPLRLFPMSGLRNPAHFRPSVRDRFQTAILGMRATGLQSYLERLPGGMHDRIRDFEAPLVQSPKNLNRYPSPGLGPGISPWFCRLLSSVDENGQISLRICDA